MYQKTKKRKKKSVLMPVITIILIIGLSLGLSLNLISYNKIKKDNVGLKTEVASLKEKGESNEELKKQLEDFQLRVENLEKERERLQSELDKTVSKKKDKNNNSTSEKIIALTFDDGPNENTPKILDLLKEKGMKATFFVLGSQVEKYPALAKRIVDEGHEIANHSYIHPNLTKKDSKGVRNEMMKSNKIIESASGGKSRLMRAPGGHFNETVKNFCKEEGWRNIRWSVDTLDWEHHDPQKLYDIAFQKGPYGVRDGAIVLMHDVHKETAEGAKLLINRLIEENYKTVTVSELLDIRAKGGVAGDTYTALPPSI